MLSKDGKPLSLQGMKNGMRAMRTAMKYVDNSSVVYSGLERELLSLREDLYATIGQTILAQIKNNALTYNQTPAVLVADMKHLLKNT